MNSPVAIESKTCEPQIIITCDSHGVPTALESFGIDSVPEVLNVILTLIRTVVEPCNSKLASPKNSSNYLS